VCLSPWARARIEQGKSMEGARKEQGKSKETIAHHLIAGVELAHGSASLGLGREVALGLATKDRV
jgi:hypothetical protein